MRGGALPPALLFTALGLAFAFAPRQGWETSLAAVTIAAAALTFVPVSPAHLEGVFVGCWISVAGTAASVYLPRGLCRRGALALSLNAGVWAGAVVSLAGSRLDLVKALPCVLIFLPAMWAVRLRLPIVVRVASSWLIAIAILAVTLQFLPVTPGYLPDHME